MVAETFGLSIAVGVSEENNNMDRIPTTKVFTNEVKVCNLGRMV